MKLLTATRHSEYTQLVAIAITLVVAAIAYLYFLNISVVQVVMRKEALQTKAELKAEIALLETAYIESQHTIAARVAVLEGYDTEVDKVFLTMNDRETLVQAN